MKNISLALVVNSLVLCSLLLPNITFAASSSETAKDQIITMLLEKISKLESEIALLKKESKSVKVEITSQNTDYSKKIKPLLDSLKKKEGLREKASIKLSESTCLKPSRVNSGGKVKFICRDKSFILNKAINVSQITNPNAKQKTMIASINKLDAEIEEINNKIDEFKTLYGIK